MKNIICNPCIPTWRVYRSDKEGIYLEQYTPMEKAYDIYHVKQKRDKESYIRFQVDKMNVSKEEKELIYNELLENQ
jgi:hypothetical protein